MKAKILEDRAAYSGFFKLRRVTVEYDRFDGSGSGPQVREVLVRSDASAALLYDPAADKVVMIEEYRAGAHLAGVSPWLIDIVAGRIEAGQSPLETVRREIVEEAGLAPGRILPIGSYLAAPHLSSERLHLFCATVDAARARGIHGLAQEGEDIRPVVLDRAAAIALPASRPLSLWAALALDWLDRAVARGLTFT